MLHPTGHLLEYPPHHPAGFAVVAIVEEDASRCLRADSRLVRLLRVVQVPEVDTYFHTDTWNRLSQSATKAGIPVWAAGEVWVLVYEGLVMGSDGTVTGTAPQGFVVQASANLANWVRLSTNTLTAGMLDYTNSGIGGIPYRYYRTVSPL